MTDIIDLQNIAAELYESNDSRKWLFAHTATQDEYMQVRRALKVLAGFKPVQWEGKTGNRHPVEVL